MLEIALHNSRQHRQFQHTAGPILLARTSADALWTTVDADRSHEAQAVVEILPEGGSIRLQLVGCGTDFIGGRWGHISPDGRLDLPAQFSIGDTRFEICGQGGTRIGGRPLEILIADKQFHSPAAVKGNGPSPATLSRWFDALGTLHRWVNCAQEFFVQAAQCAVDSIGLDGAAVLRRRDDRWEIVASHLPHPELGIHCDMAALDQLIETPRTLFHGASSSAETGDEVEPAAEQVDEIIEVLAALNGDDAATCGDPPSWMLPRNPKAEAREAKPAKASRAVGGANGDEVAVVVAPLFNAAHQLSGAIYGFRSVRAGNSRRGIRYLEAHLIELLANAVSEGVTRLEREAEVDRRRVLMDQARQATAAEGQRPASGERREVTLLFADLRGSSKFTQSLGAEMAFELLGDVMDVLTAAVMDHDGVVIDYYGDGLAAMWNAPADQADHAELACRAALRMVEALPAVRERWAGVLRDDLRLGVGVHTGIAHVGNAGSNWRWKYGPRGSNVNLTSRIEAATKLIGVPILVTRAVDSRLSNRLHTYRICRGRLPGIKEPVDLYGVVPANVDAAISAEIDDYRTALELFESGQLAESARCLQDLNTPFARVPARFLAEHVEQLLMQQRGRRKSDTAAEQSDGVIALNVK